jgi:hypothetical protein
MKTTSDFPSLNERDPEGVNGTGKAYRVLVVDDSMLPSKLIKFLHLKDLKLLLLLLMVNRVWRNIRNCSQILILLPWI